MKSLYVLVAILFASIIVAAAQQTAYNKYVFQQVAEGTNLPPLGREGTAYGNVGGRQVYFAGGVNTLYPSASSFTAFKDVYAYDTAKNVFYRSPTDLPGPSYFGVGFALDTKLYIYSGRTNSAGSQSANTYFNDMYVVDYSTDVANPTVTTVSLTPPVASRQYASGFLTKKGLFLIFGGVNGPSGSTAVSSDDVFFAIDTKANGLTAKIACGANCPATSVVNPAVFMNQAETKFYVYGGMLSDSQTFADNTKLYVYDLDDEEWKTPITVSNPAKLVWNSWALNADVSRLLLLGGDNGTSSDVKSWSWDLTTDPPKLEQLPAMLPYRCESGMVGIDANGTAWLYSGAIYNSPTDGSAAQYLHGVLKFVLNPYTPPSQYDSCMFPEVCTEFDLMQIDTSHVLLGLFLSLCAGLGTLAGGLITFLPGAGEGNIWFVGGLGIAGGVMLWISLRELFPTAESYFCCDYSHHYITATTIAFFIGLLFGIILDFLVQWASRMETQNDTVRKYLCCKWSNDYEEIADPSANEMEERKRLYEEHGDQAATVMEMMSLDTGGAPSERMTKMGIINALVVAIHNFPEGVATFMATLASPPLGLAVAVAICSHNIPEGFAIALPLNVGTGNKVRALVYTFFAGMAEPLGALAGWIIFSRFIGPWLFGAMFGVIAGLLTYISLHEIIPVAHKFDPTDRYSTYFILLGILLMIVTMVVFIDF